MFARRQKRRRAIWSAFAAEQGARHIVPRGWLAKERERIEARVGEVSVTMETYKTGWGGNRTDCTACSARPLHGPIPRCRIYREFAPQSLAKALGSQDVSTSNEAFNERFMVKCVEPGAIRRMLRARVMEWMLSSQFQYPRLECDRDEVRLVEVGAYDDPTKMRAAFELVSEVAACDVYGVQSMRAIPGARFVPAPEEGSPRAEIDGSARVVVSSSDEEDKLVTTARLVGKHRGQAMTLLVDDGWVTERAQEARLPQAAQVFVPKLGTGRLEVTADSARFVWFDIETNPDRLKAGARLLEALTAHTIGAFR